MLNDSLIKSKIKEFLVEDLQTGDLTATVIPNDFVKGYYLAKADGVVSGMDIPQVIFEVLESSVVFTPLVSDGQKVKAGTVLGRVSGPAQDILAAERLSLNLMQRMSGIATQTSIAVETLADNSIKILDTRKTAPGLRVFDKYAVTCGGGQNHRMGLFDAVMLKDNHWKMIGSLKDAIQTLRSAIGPTKVIEVEVETESELRQAVEANVDIIMFDNQEPAVVKEWRKLVPTTIKVELSGGITNETIHDYAGTGADYISLGYLTNSVQNLDISFYLED